MKFKKIMDQGFSLVVQSLPSTCQPTGLIPTTTKMNSKVLSQSKPTEIYSFLKYTCNINCNVKPTTKK